MVSISRGLRPKPTSRKGERSARRKEEVERREWEAVGGREAKEREHEPDRPEVDDLNVDTLLSEVLSSLETVSDHLGVSNDGDVGSLSLDLAQSKSRKEERSASGLVLR